MFSVVSACLSTGVGSRGRVPMWPLPMMYWTSKYRDSWHVQTCSNLDLHCTGTCQPPPQACSNLFRPRCRGIPPPTGADIWWSTEARTIWQAGSMHSTGILSCLWRFSVGLRWHILLTRFCPQSLLTESLLQIFVPLSMKDSLTYLDSHEYRFKPAKWAKTAVILLNAESWLDSLELCSCLYHR